MHYSELAALYDKLLSTTKKLEKRDMIVEFLKHTPKDLLEPVVLMIDGSVFPHGEQQDLGVASRMAMSAIRKSTGASETEFVKEFKKTGDLGSAAEKFVARRKQLSFAQRQLDVQTVFEKIRSLASMQGPGSQERKLAVVSELLSRASPSEAKYIVRTILGNMRTGAASGILRDAIAKAFDVMPHDLEEAYNTLTDWGAVATIAATKGKKGLDEAALALPLGRPIRVQLAEKSESLAEALEAFDHPVIEWKYDGFRVQIHKDGEKVWIFSRRLEDVSHQFPELKQWAQKQISAKRAIVEGEVIAVDKNGNPIAFQSLSQRIQRKYDIEKMVKEIPIRANLFECLFVDGKSLLKSNLKERWALLSTIIKETENFRLADHIETKEADTAQGFYENALRAGQEGVMVKNVEAHYQPGKRVGYWLKVKPIMQTLDLVVVGAEWGEGRKAKYLSSYILAARDEKGNLLETGRMSSGLTDTELDQITKELKPLIQRESGKIVAVKPKIVLEVGYEEIQKSPKYPSGFALRFPRMIRFRPDRGPSDCETVRTIEMLYSKQRGRKYTKKS
jgi:DNA ligase 1